jgi:hypothetical protein
MLASEGGRCVLVPFLSTRTPQISGDAHAIIYPTIAALFFGFGGWLGPQAAAAAAFARRTAVVQAGTPLSSLWVQGGLQLVVMESTLCVPAKFAARGRVLMIAEEEKRELTTDSTAQYLGP